MCGISISKHTLPSSAAAISLPYAAATVYNPQYSPWRRIDSSKNNKYTKKRFLYIVLWGPLSPAAARKNLPENFGGSRGPAAKREK